MTVSRFDAAVGEAAVRLGPSRLRRLADLLDRAEPAEVVVQSFPGDETDVETIVRAAADEPGAALYLRGAATGLSHPPIEVESVWSGPAVNGVPVRAMAQVLTRLIEGTTAELVLMTYSARPYPPVREALAGAVVRRAQVTIVVETLQGAGSALQGEEPAAAFHGIGAELWRWSAASREKGAKMHAKLAVGDRRELLVSSANLTQSGVVKNIEAGLLVRGGSAPRRAAEHVAALRAAGVLERL